MNAMFARRAGWLAAVITLLMAALIAGVTVQPASAVASRPIGSNQLPAEFAAEPPRAAGADSGIACWDNAYRVEWRQAGVYVERSQSSHLIKTKVEGDRVTGPAGWHNYWDPWDGHYWTKLWLSDGVSTGWMRSGALSFRGCA